MIPATPIAAQPPDWRRLWREAVRDPLELLELVGLPGLANGLAGAAAAAFPLRVPRGFVARMRRGDAADPLLRQVLPLDAEDRLVPGFSLDAVGDHASRVASGVLHKYAGRTLLVATGSCAVHCRYCFRRHFPYAEESAAAGRWEPALQALAADPSTRELILSGGDPLSLSNQRLAELLGRLPAIGHLRTLRIHTRLPVVLPERVDTGLCDLLRSSPLRTVVVVHANHANEIDAGVAAAFARIRDTGATLLNQSVLLRGVNDDTDALVELSEQLFQAGALPYYLHQLDRVAGVAHFEVDDQRARALAGSLRGRLPGYLVPRLVREVPGDVGKRPL